jgi:DNA-directed RNA polymerase subunit M/transcription elongation factor TFIIS
MKTCTQCQRLLELDEFPMDRGRRYAKCRTCKALQVSRYEQTYRHGSHHKRPAASTETVK